MKDSEDHRLGHRKRIIVAVPFDDEWKWLSHHFPTESYDWTFSKSDGIRSGRITLLLQGMRVALRASAFDIVVTHGPWLCLFTAFFMKLLGKRTPLLAFTFNHGNKRFFSGLFLIIARWSLMHVSAFVTHSSMERKLYAQKYSIDENRILFTHWAVDRPKVGRRSFASSLENYVCCIGRNNRDFNTFIGAVKESGVPAILICGKGQLSANGLPDNIVVGFDIPKEECDCIMADALANVIPLFDDSTGAGHMTIVTSLLFGVPIVATNVQSVSDYVLHGVTGILVERSSVSEMARAFRRLKDDAVFRKTLSKQASSFADEHLTEVKAAEFLRKVLEIY